MGARRASDGAGRTGAALRAGTPRAAASEPAPAPAPRATEGGAAPGPFVLPLGQLDRTQVAVAGGKGANLGELTRVEGVVVPDGFCVTTHAFRHALGHLPSIDEGLRALAGTDPADRDALGDRSAAVRHAIEHHPLPADLAAEVVDAVRRSGEDVAWAVRSSATAEDLPGASFAGQHESFLNVEGAEEVLRHVVRCWASLFTERAVAYRLRNGVDHRDVAMAVVVQELVVPEASGVLFTAHPATSDRTVTSIEATPGLGEALVSGRVAADVFEVRAGRILSRAVARKEHAVRADPEGGTCVVAVGAAERDRPVLTDAQVVALEALGRRLERRFGTPQDVEWCLVDGGLRIVQSRPITTLFPVPETDDGARHVYISVGHQQMMTDPMTPLGLSMWQLTALRPMTVAGGRLFVDVTQALASPAGRTALLANFGRGDVLVRDALETLLALDGVDLAADAGAAASPAGGGAAPASGDPPPVEADPAIVAELIARTDASLVALTARIRSRSGPALFDLLIEDLDELKRLLADPASMQVLMAGLEASWWLDDHLRAWLGDKGAADVLTRAAPGNVTSEMGLALLDVADAVRPHPEVVALLREMGGDDAPDLLDRLSTVEGGAAAGRALGAFLDRYGARCIGEIDIGRPRWRDRPGALVPVLLSHVDNLAPGERARRVERGRQEAAAKEREVVERLRSQPDGADRADEAERMIERLRTFIGYREFPKYGWMRRYAVYRDALLAEAERLVEAGVVEDQEDVFFLTFHELHEAVRTRRCDADLVARRRAELRAFQALTPPRVLTSDGLALTGSHRRDDLPAGALPGMAVSAGTVEGRARVVLDVADADLDPGDVLVTPQTDPSWSPLFVAASGLVTEVGGLMTHGAVVAREYGLPAVVGVDGATRRIRDGQRIRVHGTDGYVELLDEGEPGRHGCG